MLTIRSNAWFRSDQMHGFDPIKCMVSIRSNAWFRTHGNQQDWDCSIRSKGEEALSVHPDLTL